MTSESYCEVYVLDFDWAEKEGEVKYPYELNTHHACKWHNGVMLRGGVKKTTTLYTPDGNFGSVKVGEKALSKLYFVTLFCHCVHS